MKENQIHEKEANDLNDKQKIAAQVRKTHI